MPVDYLAGGLLSSLFRFIAWVFVELVIDILIKGLGYLVCRPFKKVELESSAAFIVGIVSWLVVIVTLVIVFVEFSNDENGTVIVSGQIVSAENIESLDLVKSQVIGDLLHSLTTCSELLKDLSQTSIQYSVVDANTIEIEFSEVRSESYTFESGDCDMH